MRSCSSLWLASFFVAADSCSLGRTVFFVGSSSPCCLLASPCLLSRFVHVSLSTYMLCSISLEPSPHTIDTYFSRLILSVQTRHPSIHPSIHQPPPTHPTSHHLPSPSPSFRGTKRKRTQTARDSDRTTCGLALRMKDVCPSDDAYSTTATAPPFGLSRLLPLPWWP